MESYSKTRYQALRSMHRCVACGCPAEKSRCPKCMKNLEQAVKKSQRKRLKGMQNRIKELERMLSECGAESVIANESARTP